METGATASVPRDMGEEKDEPDFFETHCHWVECDREMGCNDELVKVISQLNEDGIVSTFTWYMW